jgi:hypothetical protein
MCSNNPENTPRAAQAVGVRERGAARGLATDVIEPRLMALHGGFNPTQRSGASKLAVHKRDELVAGLERAHEIVGPVLFHKAIENIPRDQLEQTVEDAILMPHGGDLSCPVDSQPSGTEQNQCRALHQAENVPDSRGTSPAMTRER